MNRQDRKRLHKLKCKVTIAGRVETVCRRSVEAQIGCNCAPVESNRCAGNRTRA